jgi:hypothetical protein
VPSAPDRTQWAERTSLARQRSALAFLLIAALLATHTHAWLGVSAALVIAAAGLRAHSPRELALATVLASVTGVLALIA